MGHDQQQKSLALLGLRQRTADRWPLRTAVFSDPAAASKRSSWANSEQASAVKLLLFMLGGQLGGAVLGALAGAVTFDCAASVMSSGASLLPNASMAGAVLGICLMSPALCLAGLIYGVSPGRLHNRRPSANAR